jgi:hypothetical protein
MRLSSGLESLVPLTPSSTHSPATVQPRRWLYSRNSRNCISGDCSDVLARAYKATLTICLHVLRQTLRLPCGSDSW